MTNKIEQLLQDQASIDEILRISTSEQDVSHGKKYTMVVVRNEDELWRINLLNRSYDTNLIVYGTTLALKGSLESRKLIAHFIKTGEGLEKEILEFDPEATREIIAASLVDLERED